MYLFTKRRGLGFQPLKEEGEKKKKEEGECHTPSPAKSTFHLGDQGVSRARGSH